jgi:Fur family ferric uptake transcriptional regulator
VRPSFSSDRKRVLAAVETAGQPISAKLIHRQVGDEMNFATVYRALRYLEGRGLVQGFTLVCDKEGTQRYYYPGGTPHLHYLHCEVCHGFEAFEESFIEDSVARIQKAHEFTVHAHVLYFIGTCSSCNQAPAIDGSEVASSSS